MNAKTRRLVPVLAATCILLGFAGVAAAVSTGGYHPAQQDCSPSVDAWNTVTTTQPGCHNFKLNVSDTSGHRYAEFGVDQVPDKTNAHAGVVRFNTNGDGSGTGVSSQYDTNYQPIPPGGPSEFGLFFYPVKVLTCLSAGGSPSSCTFTPSLPDPSQPAVLTPTVQTGPPDTSAAGLATGTSVYLGADDNLNTGEHDGVDGMSGTANSANGPSDGGAVVVNWHPLDVAGWVTSLLGGGNPDPMVALTNPVPVVDAGEGECTDGACASAQTRQRAVYHGGGGSGDSRNVYDYEKKTWDPQQCSSGDARAEANCSDPNQGGTPGGMDAYRAQEARNVNAEPGVQVYEDPDPQGSPIGPYPLPAAYAGTCGVVAGGGPMAQAPESPVTNKAGQVMVSTGC